MATSPVGAATPKKGGKYLNIRMITKIAILSALAVLVMLLDVPLGFAPSFYKLDFSEVFVLLGGFSLGPIAAVIIEFIKVLLNLLMNGTSTACAGELANFLIGCALVVPASIIFKKKPNLKGAIIGCVVGTASLTIFGCLINAFVLLPVYAFFFHMPMEALIEMGTALNAHITSLFSFVVLAVAPFNLLKGVSSSIIVCLLYKKLVPFLQK